MDYNKKYEGLKVKSIFDVNIENLKGKNSWFCYIWQMAKMLADKWVEMLFKFSFVLELICLSYIF